MVMYNVEDILDDVWDKHWFNHRGRCECGRFTSMNPSELREHLKMETLIALEKYGVELRK